MPYDVKKSKECGNSKPWTVVKGDGEVMGCHASQYAARQQQTALYAAERMERQADTPLLVSRSMVVRAEGQGLQVVTATENPVMVFDGKRGSMVPEVLQMDGIEMRSGQTQIPIVDSHDQSTVRNIFGSLRSLRVVGDELVGTPFFAADADSQAAEQKLRDGHLTDFSITAIPREVLELSNGQSYTTPRGTVVNGPANVVTRWTPINASLVATGADERSTVRRTLADKLEIKRMDEVLLKKLMEMGLPEGMSDPGQILAWVVGKMGSSQPAVEEMETPEPIESADKVAEEMAAEGEKPAEMVESMSGDKKTERSIDATEQIKRALETDKARRKEITAICTLHGIERAYADELCDGFVSLDDARKRILERMATQPVGQSAESARVVGSEQDRLAEVITGGLVLRSFQAAGIRRTKPEVPEGSQEFSRLPLWRMGEAILRSAGVKTDRMSPKDIAQALLHNSGVQRRFGIERSAYHTTGTFSNLLLDASNKTLLAAYEETPATWNIWARQGASVSDFKNINRIRFSEAPNPEQVPERHAYPEAVMSDARESYRVEKFGQSFTVSWETIVNDDLDALARVPAMHGAAMRRKVNAAVYGVLTANDPLADGIALFNSSHANVSSGASVVSTTSLDAGYLAMMTQKGLNSAVNINVTPTYLIAPAAISSTVLQLLASLAPPSAGGNAVGNANVANIYGPKGDRPLIPVIDPVLDASSGSVWYLVADPSKIDTVEVSFLEGEESPVLESEWDMRTDCYYYKIRQTFGVKAIDFRGVYRNAA